MKVIIIDYKLGNLFSVKHACERLGIEVEISSDRKKLEQADAAILPGVGAFGDAMDNLQALDLVTGIREFIQTGKPFMGICLGMQLLFTESEEFGNYKGLDIIPGEIKRFPKSLAEEGIKVPQIGWNQIYAPKGKSWDESPLQDTQEGEFMYFVHSYYTQPVQQEVIMTETTYGTIKFCSCIQYKNVFATQYHPEKSAHEGLKLYKNWSQKINPN